MIEEILYKGKQISIIIRSGFCSEGIQFFTSDDSPQQLAYMNRPKGYVIEPHVHNFVKREITYTQEVLYIKSGQVRVDYYDELQNYIESRTLYAGDVVLLSGGGHGFYMDEVSEIIEIKQGPYVGGKDKKRFNPIDKNKVRIK